MLYSVVLCVFSVPLCNFPKVMLDSDLARLYEVPVKTLNQAVKRNIERFPSDFMFRLTDEEWKDLRSQIVTLALISENFALMLSQKRALPCFQVFSKAPRRLRSILQSCGRLSRYANSGLTNSFPHILQVSTTGDFRRARDISALAHSREHDFRLPAPKKINCFPHISQVSLADCLLSF